MSADDWTLLLDLLSVSIAAGSLGHMLGRRRGILRERKRVLDGLGITQAYLLSRSLRVLRSWVEGHYTRDELLARVKEYGAEKEAKHDGEQQALLERLGRHGEKKA
jgi:hypothetical protein